MRWFSAVSHDALPQLWDSWVLSIHLSPLVLLSLMFSACWELFPWLVFACLSATYHPVLMCNHSLKACLCLLSSAVNMPGFSIWIHLLLWQYKSASKVSKPAKFRLLCSHVRITRAEMKNKLAKLKIKCNTMSLLDCFTVSAPNITLHPYFLQITSNQSWVPL